MIFHYCLETFLYQYERESLENEEVCFKSMIDTTCIDRISKKTIFVSVEQKNIYKSIKFSQLAEAVVRWCSPVSEIRYKQLASLSANHGKYHARIRNFLTH